MKNGKATIPNIVYKTWVLSCYSMFSSTSMFVSVDTNETHTPFFYEHNRYL